MQHLRLEEGFELADVPVDVPADQLDPQKAKRKAKRQRKLAEKAKPEEQDAPYAAQETEFPIFPDQTLQQRVEGIMDGTEEDPQDRAKFELVMRKQDPATVLAKRLAGGDEKLAKALCLEFAANSGLKLEPTIREVDGKQIKFYRTYEHKLVFTEYGVDDEGNIYRYSFNGWVLEEDEFESNPEVLKALGLTDAEIQVLTNPVSVEMVDKEKLLSRFKG